MFFFCILHYHLHCTINYHEPRSITIHYDPVRSTTIHFSIACTLSIHTRSQIDQTQSHRWKAPRIPRRCPAWTTTSTTKVKGCTYRSLQTVHMLIHLPSFSFSVVCCVSLSLSLPLSVADLKAGTTLLVPSYRVVRSFATPDTTAPEAPVPVAAADVATASGPDGT